MPITRNAARSLADSNIVLISAVRLRMQPIAPSDLTTQLALPVLIRSQAKIA